MTSARSCLTVCGKGRVTRHHESTLAHRSHLAGRNLDTRAGRGIVPAGVYALRHWDDQYAEQDPGNSPEWTAAYAAAGGA